MPARDSNVEGGAVLATARTSLAEGLRAQHPESADQVADPMTSLTLVEAPFLRSWQLYRVDVRNPYRPVSFYAATDGRRAFRLTGDTGAFEAMAREDEPRIDSTDLAVRYAKVFLEVTRSTAAFTSVVEGVDDIRFRPNLSPELERSRDEVIERLRPILRPVSAEKAPNGWVVTAFVLRADILERRTLNITNTGTIRDNVSMVERDLPVPYSR